MVSTIIHIKCMEQQQILSNNNNNANLNHQSSDSNNQDIQQSDNQYTQQPINKQDQVTKIINDDNQNLENLQLSLEQQVNQIENINTLFSLKYSGGFRKSNYYKNCNAAISQENIQLTVQYLKNTLLLNKIRLILNRKHLSIFHTDESEGLFKTLFSNNMQQRLAEMSIDSHLRLFINEWYKEDLDKYPTDNINLNDNQNSRIHIKNSRIHIKKQAAHDFANFLNNFYNTNQTHKLRYDLDAKNFIQYVAQTFKVLTNMPVFSFIQLASLLMSSNTVKNTIRSQEYYSLFKNLLPQTYLNKSQQLYTHLKSCILDKSFMSIVEFNFMTNTEDNDNSKLDSKIIDAMFIHNFLRIFMPVIKNSYACINNIFILLSSFEKTLFQSQSDQQVNFITSNFHQLIFDKNDPICCNTKNLNVQIKDNDKKMILQTSYSQDNIMQSNKKSFFMCCGSKKNKYVQKHEKKNELLEIDKNNIQQIDRQNKKKLNKEYKMLEGKIKQSFNNFAEYYNKGFKENNQEKKTQFYTASIQYALDNLIETVYSHILKLPYDRVTDAKNGRWDFKPSKNSNDQNYFNLLDKFYLLIGGFGLFSYANQYPDQKIEQIYESNYQKMKNTIISKKNSENKKIEKQQFYNKKDKFFEHIVSYVLLSCFSELIKDCVHEGDKELFKLLKTQVTCLHDYITQNIFERKIKITSSLGVNMYHYVKTHHNKTEVVPVNSNKKEDISTQILSLGLKHQIYFETQQQDIFMNLHNKTILFDKDCYVNPFISKMQFVVYAKPNKISDELINTAQKINKNNQSKKSSNKYDYSSIKMYANKDHFFHKILQQLCDLELEREDFMFQVFNQMNDNTQYTKNKNEIKGLFTSILMTCAFLLYSNQKNDKNKNIINQYQQSPMDYKLFIHAIVTLIIQQSMNYLDDYKYNGDAGITLMYNNFNTILDQFNIVSNNYQLQNTEQNDIQNAKKLEFVDNYPEHQQKYMQKLDQIVYDSIEQSKEILDKHLQRSYYHQQK